MLRNGYDHFFYKLTRWDLMVNGGVTSPFAICAMMTFPFAFNIATCLMIGDLLGAYRLHVPKLVAALAAVAVMGLNYLYFGTNDRAAKIIRRYKNEAGRASRWGTVIVTVYVVGSMLLLFGVGALTLYLSQQRLELLKLG